jgi:hypothetical protein
MTTIKQIELGRVSKETREMGPGPQDNPLTKLGPLSA